MAPALERRALQIAVAVLALVPIVGGLSGALMGQVPFVAMDPMLQADARGFNVSLDSHFRYLSGLLLGIGLVAWSTIPAIERHGTRFRLITAIVFVGGLARLYGVVVMGWPGPPMVFGLVMELVVTPLLCLWQWRVARAVA